MAEFNSIKIPAHRNIYNGFTNRDLRIDFSIPSSGVNPETGICIVVPGFGGNIESTIYKKMKEVFADQYNLVTIQCEYFGSEFMQNVNSFNLNCSIDDVNDLLKTSEKEMLNKDPSKLIEILSSYSITLPVIANLSEDENCFNDMGYLQAIDVITAIEAVKIILKENGLIFNDRKIIGYGHSHGAFLLHLCNRLVPNQFSHIIDNSAWIEPVYLNSNRYLFQSYGSMTLQIEFDYFAKKNINDINSLNLEFMYNEFNNEVKIIIFQGTSDNLINHVLKEDLFKNVPYTEFILIGDKEVDNQIYKSNRHGLDADFIKMFEFGLSQLGDHINNASHKDEYEMVISQTKISVDYTKGLPIFSFKKI